MKRIWKRTTVFLLSVVVVMIMSGIMAFAKDDIVTVNDYFGTYDGKEHSITLTADKDVEVTYSTAEDGEYTSEIPTFINAGEYKVYYKATKDDMTDDGCATVKIDKKKVTITAKDQTIAAGENQLKPDITAIDVNPPLAEGDSILKFSFVIEGDAFTEGGAITPNSVKIMSRIQDVTKNYEITYVNGTLTVYKERLDNVHAEGYNGTYDGKAHNITVTAPEGAKITYATEKGGLYTETNPTYTEAGTYVVYYKAEKENYAPVTGSEKVVIEEASFDEDEIQAEDYVGTYDGMAYNITVEAPEGAQITYATEKAGPYTETNPTYTEAGTYIVYYKVKKANYVTETGSAEVIIEEASFDEDEIEVENYVGTYDGMAYNITVTAPEEVKITYATKKEGPYTETNPTYTEVGTYVVYYKVEKANYVTVTGSEKVVIEEASFDEDEIEAENYVGTYDGKAHNITVTAPEGVKITYATKKEGPYTETNPTYTEVGTYVVYYKVEKANYVTETGSAEVIIEEVNFAEKDVQAENYVGTYDGKAHSITVTAPEGAKITYAAKKEGPYTETKPTFTVVGTHHVYYKVEKGQKVITGEASVIIEAEKALAKSAIEKNESALNVKIAAAWKGSSIEVKWGKVSGAKGYDIYLQECGKRFNRKNITKTVNASKTSAIMTKIAGKKLNKNKNYKVVVRAYRMANGKKEYIAKSLIIHFAAKNSKTYTDAKKVTLAKKTFTLKKGKTAVLKVKITKKNNKRKLLSKKHGASLCYWSTNKKVATVTSSGKVKAVAKGSCYVYVTSLNGTKVRAKITVK